MEEAVEEHQKRSHEFHFQPHLAGLRASAGEDGFRDEFTEGTPYEESVDDEVSFHGGPPAYVEYEEGIHPNEQTLHVRVEQLGAFRGLELLVDLVETTRGEKQHAVQHEKETQTGRHS